MKFPPYSSPNAWVTSLVMTPRLKIDGASPTVTTSDNIKRPLLKTAAFSLVEVTLALGVAAFCLVAVLGLLPTSLRTQQTSIQQTTANQIISTIFSDLRAALRLPPGLESKVCGDDPGPCAWGDLHGHWHDAATPFKLYFTNEGKQIGALNAYPPPRMPFSEPRLITGFLHQRPPPWLTSGSLGQRGLIPTLPRTEFQQAQLGV
jgi:type II secretory pathway pseudopilin PulG